MNVFEKYQPSSGEIKKAEEMMTAVQREMTKSREQFKFQERPAFHDETVLDLDKGDERREPTSEEREEMDNNLIKLGQMFEGSDIRWQLDGALNISLMKGDYIGVHKDVDISVDPDDLEKLDAQLIKKGYGLFLSTKHPKEPEEKRLMERVSAQDFRAAPAEHLMIAAIDEKGEIRQDEPLNYLDVHLIRKDKDGNPVNWNNNALPSEWFEANPADFKGQEINLSHPAKVAYFKLHDNRPFARSDLKILAEIGKFSSADVDTIEEVVKNDIYSRKKESEKILKRISDQIKPEMTSEQIFNLFANDPRIKDGIDAMKESFEQLSQRIEKGDSSFEQIRDLAFEIFEIDSVQKKVQELRSWAGVINK